MELIFYRSYVLVFVVGIIIINISGNIPGVC